MAECSFRKKVVVGSSPVAVIWKCNDCGVHWKYNQGRHAETDKCFNSVKKKVYLGKIIREECICMKKPLSVETYKKLQQKGCCWINCMNKITVTLNDKHIDSYDAATKRIY